MPRGYTRWHAPRARLEPDRERQDVSRGTHARGCGGARETFLAHLPSTGTHRAERSRADRIGRCAHRHHCGRLPINTAGACASMFGAVSTQAHGIGSIAGLGCMGRMPPHRRCILVIDCGGVASSDADWVIRVAATPRRQRSRTVLRRAHPRPDDGRANSAGLPLAVYVLRPVRAALA